MGSNADGHELFRHKSCEDTVRVDIGIPFRYPDQTKPYFHAGYVEVLVRAFVRFNSQALQKPDAQTPKPETFGKKHIQALEPLKAPCSRPSP